MIESKLSKCAAEFGHCIGRAYQRQGCGDHNDRETNCFHEKIVSRFVLKILTADIPKVRPLTRERPAAKPIQRHGAIIALHQRGSVVLANNY